MEPNARTDRWTMVKRMILPALAAVLVAAGPLTASAQQTAVGLSYHDLAAARLTGTGTLRISAPGALLPGTALEAASGAPYQGYYHRIDWEIGRGWLSAAIGLGLAYVGDLLIHYETDFSKANPMLDEERGGEAVYNVLLYGGLTPYYALRGVKSVHPLGGNSVAGYLSGAVGTLAGLAYWTTTGDAHDPVAIILTTGLTSIFTTIGYHLF
ncbi:MAG: hypothetical protein R6W82_04630 [bacterium]